MTTIALQDQRGVSDKYYVLGHYSVRDCIDFTGQVVEVFHLGERGGELEPTLGHPSPLLIGERESRLSKNHHEGQPKTTPACGREPDELNIQCVPI